MANRFTVILSRSRTPESSRRLLEEKLLQELMLRPDVELTVIPHVYDLTPDGPAVQALRTMTGDLFVLSWLYPRATYWTLTAHGVHGRLGPTTSLEPGDDDTPSEQQAATAPARTLWCFDLRVHVQPEPYLNEIDRIVGKRLEAAARTSPYQEIAGSVRPRWYPVIDESRCIDCLECLNFCLFGVYGLGQENTILIEQPDACRPGCPACSRICPQGAIMFPQHADPAIAGDPQASLHGMKLDLSQLLSGVDPAQLAELERQRALQGKPVHGESPSLDLRGKGHAAEPPAPEKDRLDRLVDEVDRLDL